jgi:hypothetical protein
VPIFILLLLSGLIFPNITTSALELFSDIGGTASAVYGSCLLAGTTIFVTKIKTNTQEPMAYMYASMFFICLILFIAVHKFKKKVHHN